MPISATRPLTVTQPLSIHSSASRREAMPSSAMRLFRRTVPLAPWAAVLAWPAGIGALAGGGAARRKVGGGFWSVICYKFESCLRTFYGRWSLVSILKFDCPCAVNGCHTKPKRYSRAYLCQIRGLNTLGIPDREVQV